MLKISRSISDKKMTTGEAFRAIREGYYKSDMGASERQTDIFYENFSITFRSIRRALQRLKEIKIHPNYKHKFFEKVQYSSLY